MTLRKILSLHAALKTAEANTADRAKELSDAVREYLEPMPVRETARKLGISPAYMADIRAGRRGVSDELVKKLKEME